jgi:hypothetical protein
MTAWADTTLRLRALEDKTLFFIGGAPRSGTTWLQQMFDAHPAVGCRGEGLFLHHLAVPLERLASERAQVVAGKNATLFTHTGGFPNLDRDDTEHLTATGILLALSRTFRDGCTAIGEKTPENVFFFPRLRAMFPRARFIGIVRDPRDALASAWHFFAEPAGQPIAPFVRAALPSIDHGLRALQAFSAAAPDQCAVVTYEALRADPAASLPPLFRLLAVDATAPTIAAVVARTTFERMAGRPPGISCDGAFLRRGTVGAWRDTLPPDLAREVTDLLGWSYPAYGWTS